MKHQQIVAVEADCTRADQTQKRRQIEYACTHRTQHPGKSIGDLAIDERRSRTAHAGDKLAQPTTFDGRIGEPGHLVIGRRAGVLAGRHTADRTQRAPLVGNDTRPAQPGDSIAGQAGQIAKKLIRA